MSRSFPLSGRPDSTASASTENSVVGDRADRVDQNTLILLPFRHRCRTALSVGMKWIVFWKPGSDLDAKSIRSGWPSTSPRIA